MAVQYNSRTSDLGEILTSGSTGFAVRKRTGIGMVFHLFLLACMVVMGAALLIYYQSPKGCLLAVAIGLSLGLIAQNLEKYKKSNQSLEFMNALFSSALGKGYQFCCVVKVTGDLVFYNRPFQALFPLYVTQKTRSLTKLMELYHFPENDRAALTTLIETNAPGTMTTHIRSSTDDPAQAITLTIEPIERPTGFFLIRGK